MTPNVPTADAMIQEVYNMTGVQDLSVISHAVNVLSTLDPVVVQTLGTLPQETLQQFMTGDVAALGSQETLEQFKDAIASGTVDIKALEESISAHTAATATTGGGSVAAGRSGGGYAGKGVAMSRRGGGGGQAQQRGAGRQYSRWDGPRAPSTRERVSRFDR